MSKVNSKLIQKLDDFTRKFYLNELLKGTIIGTALLGGLFLILAVSEYFFRLPGSVRLTGLIVFVAAFIFVLIKYIALPSYKLFVPKQGLSYDKAATIIGQHFSDVDDKLLNALLLVKEDNNALALAMVDKRAKELSPVPFEQAINVKLNWKIAPYLFGVILICGIIYFLNPSIFSSSTQHYIQYNIPFDKMAPYDFQLKNTDLNVKKGQNLTVNVSLQGKEIPTKLFLKDSRGSWRMDQKEAGVFSLTIENIENDFNFVFNDGEFQSESYSVNVLAVPQLNSFKYKIQYPSHIENGKSVTKNGLSEIVIPEGSLVSWELDMENVDSATVLTDNATNLFIDKDNTIKSDVSYDLIVHGVSVSDTVVSDFKINVEKDLAPKIQVEMVRDSVNLNVFYFSGEFKDDHGIKNISAVFDNGRSEPIEFDGFKEGRFFYSLNINDSAYKEATNIKFKVSDNDVVNGYKESFSKLFVIAKSDREKVSKLQNEKEKNLESEIEQLSDKAKKLDKKLKDFKDQLLQKEKSDWSDKKKFKELMNERKNIQEEAENLKKKNEELNNFRKQNTKLNEEILEKQQKLNELFDEIADEDFKKKMKEMEEMLEKLDKDELLEKMEELSPEELNEQLDRNLELFERFKVENDFNQLKEDLQKIREEQEELQNDDKSSPEENAAKQDSLNKEFDDFKKKLDETEKKAQELDMDELSTGDKKEGIDKEMKNASQQMKQGNKKQGKKSQSKSAEMMKELEQKMGQSLSMQSSKQMEMNIETLRQIQENLIELSFRQEAVIDSMKILKSEDPRYVSVIENQHGISEDVQVVEDSLRALAKKAFFLDPIINKEMKIIDESIASSVDNYADRKQSKGLMESQEAMTSFNNLALMIGEMLEQMQKQMSKQKFGQNQCNKPGSGKGSKPGMKKMKQMQKELSKNMEKLKKQMEQGSPGGKKGKKKGQQGSPRMSKEIGKMMGKQKSLRETLRKIQNDQEGTKAGDQLKKLDQKMEENERDILEKKIDKETLRRQQEILTKMLEVEESIRQQGKKKERESKSSNLTQETVPDYLQKYLKEKEKEAELFRGGLLDFNPYYRGKIDKYLLDESN